MTHQRDLVGNADKPPTIPWPQGAPLAIFTEQAKAFAAV